MKKSIIALALLATTSASFAGGQEIGMPLNPITTMECKLFDTASNESLGYSIKIGYYSNDDNLTLGYAKSDLPTVEWKIRSVIDDANYPQYTRNLISPFDAWNDTNLISTNWDNSLSVYSYQLDLNGNISYLSGNIWNTKIRQKFETVPTYVCGELQTPSEMAKVKQTLIAPYIERARNSATRMIQAERRARSLQRAVSFQSQVISNQVQSINELSTKSEEYKSTIERMNAENIVLLAKIKSNNALITELRAMITNTIDIMNAEAQTKDDQIKTLKDSLDWYKRELQLANGQISILEMNNIEDSVSRTNSEVQDMFDDNRVDGQCEVGTSFSIQDNGQDCRAVSQTGAGGMGIWLYVLLPFFQIARMISKKNK